jgi:glycosyltransferase involved in cell wall biosynthesis
MFDRARLAARATWSPSAVSKVRSVLKSSRSEIVHHHNLFPTLSPAVLRASGEAATVGTLHNFRHLCLPATLLRDGKICEDCVGRSIAWPGVVHRCYRGSMAGSAALALSLAIHHSIGSFDRPDLYLAVSEFIKRKYIEAGWSPGRILVKSNFTWPARAREGAGTYFLYVGRLTAEKGLPMLLRAWAHVTGAKLIVVGSGPEGSQMRGTAPPGVEFVGILPPAELNNLMGGARALLVPSQWFEGQPRVILEAYAKGVPVIASAIGGIPEVIEHQRSGLLVPPHAIDEWIAALERMLDNDEAGRLGEGALARWQERYSPEVALRHLEAAYAMAIERAA